MNQTSCLKLEDAIKDNQNLIYALSKQFDYRIKEDLHQVGVIGIIDAYNHFDPTRNTKFSTYAYPYVAGEMKKFAREDRNIKVSRDIIYLCSRIERARELLQQKLRKDPSISELSFYLDIAEERIIEALQSRNHIKSIDESISEDGKELTLKDVIAQAEAYDKLDLISLREELSKLSSQERTILEKRYEDGLTQNEIACLCEISQVEVSRMEKRLILSLKSKLKQ